MIVAVPKLNKDEKCRLMVEVLVVLAVQDSCIHLDSWHDGWGYWEVNDTDYCWNLWGKEIQHTKEEYRDRGLGDVLFATCWLQDESGETGGFLKSSLLI